MGWVTDQCLSRPAHQPSEQVKNDDAIDEVEHDKQDSRERAVLVDRPEPGVEFVDRVREISLFD